MSESKKKRTEIEKLKEEKNGVEKELAEAMKKIWNRSRISFSGRRIAPIS